MVIFHGMFLCNVSKTMPFLPQCGNGEHTTYLDTLKNGDDWAL